MGPVNQGQQQPGFFDLLSDRLQSPLFQMGAGMFSAASQGDDIGTGFLKGGQAAGFAQRNRMAQFKSLQEMQQQQREAAQAQLAQAAQAERQKQFAQMTGQPIPGVSPEQMKVLQFLGPEKGGALLSRLIENSNKSPVTVNVGAGETAYDKEMGKRLAEEYIAIQQQGTKAQQAIGDLKVMEQSLEDPNVYTGMGGETIQNIKRAAQFFGVPVEGVPAGEVISRTSKQIALNLKDKLPGPMSNSDRQFLVDLPPGLTTSPEGNRRLIQIGVAQQQWLAERAQVASEIIKRTGGRLTTEALPLLADVDRKWSATMSGMVSELRSQPQAQNRSPTVGMDALRKQHELE